MTDFMPESSFAPSSQLPQMVWGSDSEGTFEPPPPAMPAQRSAAALAAATHQLLEALVAKRVPRVDSLRRKLDQAKPESLRDIEHAASLLHAEMEALDFLAGRNGGEQAADFGRHAAVVIAATQRLAGVSSALIEGHAISGPVARLLWIELVLESDSLRKRVRQGAHWLAQMNRDLGHRRAAATAEVSQRALDELARRGTALHHRLHTVHRLCGHARSIHALCEQMAEQRNALCATLKEKVVPATARLDTALQPLMEAVSYRPLVPEELMAAIEAQHEMQVCLTQVAAQVVRLQAGDQELASQLANMEQKAVSLA